MEETTSATGIIPLTFAIAGSSKIKFDALQQAVWDLEIHAAVVKIAGAISGVSEQPVGFEETWRGASNRALNAYRIHPGCDVYFGIENGIHELSPGRWVDYAVVLACLPTETAPHIEWVKSGDESSPLAALDIPTEAVERTRRKEGGFAVNTVGKTLVEMGLVKRHTDPHIDLCGESRQSILQRACIKLIKQLPLEYQLRSSNSDK